MSILARPWISRMFFDAGGYSAVRNYYYRIIRRGDAKVWDNVAKVLATAPTWIDSAIVLTNTPAESGAFPVVIPAGVEEGHTYEIVIYRRAGVSPANSDLIDSNYVEKIGAGFGF